MQRNSKKIIIITLSIILGVLLLGVFMNRSELLPSSPKKVVEKKLNRSDLTVSEVLTEKDGWMLVKVKSENSEDKGNTTYAILQENEDSLELKLGPGTYFSKYTMSSAKVPSDMQKEVESYFNKKRK